MFHGIFEMYHDAKNKKKKYHDEMISKSGLKDKIDEQTLVATEVRQKLPGTVSKSVSDIGNETVSVNMNSKYWLVMIEEQVNVLVDKLTTIPKVFDAIQPRADQVWTYNEIDIDLNGKLMHFVCI